MMQHSSAAEEAGIGQRPIKTRREKKLSKTGVGDELSLTGTLTLYVL